MTDRLIFAHILHNTNVEDPRRWLQGFEEGDDLIEVYHLPLAVTDEQEALRTVWALFNADDRSHLAEIAPAVDAMYGEHLDEYRRNMNRSLSVGDVVILGEILEGGAEAESAWACRSDGWTELIQIPTYTPEDELI